MRGQLKVKRFDKQKNQGKNLEIKTDPRRKSVILTFSKNVLITLLSCVIIIVLFVVAWIGFAQRPLSSDKADYKYFEVKSGEGAMDIGSGLESSGLIRSKWAFYLSARFNPGVLQVGNYKLSASMELDEIINKIRKGEVDAFSVTIPEGYRSLQIAKLLNEKAGVNVDKFVEAATGKEGTLFPDTYLFPRDYEPSKIVRQMQENYQKKTKELNPSDEQLIVASIVEREAKKDEERAKIAAIYFNRINKNMLLQADPTIRYGLDTQKYLETKSVDFDFWQPLTKSDISNLDSEFNTYKRKGAPPAPICNPGQKSIEAAVKPASDFSDYYYFFHDSSQNIHYSKTYAEHLENLSKYN